MGSIRNGILGRFFAIIAGVIFLNMSFVVGEFAALGLNKSNKLVENLINYGCEEEKECGESSSGADSTCKEVYLSASENLLHHHLDFLSAKKRSRDIANLSLEAGHFETFSPPPEIL